MLLTKPKFAPKILILVFFEKWNIKSFASIYLLLELQVLASEASSKSLSILYKYSWRSLISHNKVQTITNIKVL
jgi:hypothetical protein